MKVLIFIFFISSLAISASAQNKSDSTQSPPRLANFQTPQAIKIDLKDLINNVNKFVETQGLVFDHERLPNSFAIDFGAAYPNEKLMVVLTGTAFERFKTDGIDGKTVMVRGFVMLYHGAPEIVVSRLDDIKIIQ